MYETSAHIWKFVTGPFVFLLTFSILFFTSASPSFAQAGPLSENTAVTATVPDNNPPSTPILIAPSNGAYVTDSTPDFVWEESTDDYGMNYYQLFLDGDLLFSNIPLTDTDNSFYTLTYDSIEGEYTLTPKDTLTDGTHTWKIRAVDNSNHVTDSATWSFTVDTLAPSFVITAIGDQSVNISAQDLSTVPASPVELEDNEPLLLGTGEASSTITAILTIPSDPTQNFSFTIDINGNWGLQLGLLPREVIMTLDFTITDLAGNISILEDIQFIINQEVIVFPPASPSPSPDASPTPGTSPSPTPSVPPTSPEPTVPPLIEIPFTPPREIVNEVFQELFERFTIAPGPVSQALVETGRVVAPFSAVVAASAVPVFSLFAIASQFGGNLSFNLLIRLLQALGLIPAGKPQGLVFNSKTYEPVPFALLTITNEGSTRAPVHETVVTDVEGVYSGVQLTPDTYTLTASHQDYVFPTVKQRPAYINIRDYYRGEPFTVTSEKEEQLFLIPVDPIAENAQAQGSRRWRLFFSRLTRATSSLVVPIWLLSGFLTMLFPTIWNWLVFGLYSIQMLRLAWQWFKVPRVTGQVIDTHGQVVANAVIRLSLPQAAELIAVVSTNATGEFSFFVPPDKYQISVSHREYIWNEAGTALTFNEIDATQSAQHLLLTMQPAAEVYQEMFGS